jgi:hypothetical protein
MRTPVKCNNCGIKWVRVVAYMDCEMNTDLMYNCPKCGSNDYKVRERESAKKEPHVKR